MEEGGRAVEMRHDQNTARFLRVWIGAASASDNADATANLPKFRPIADTSQAVASFIVRARLAELS